MYTSYWLGNCLNMHHESNSFSLNLEFFGVYRFILKLKLMVNILNGQVSRLVIVCDVFISAQFPKLSNFHFMQRKSTAMQYQS